MLTNQITEAAEFIRSKHYVKPQAGIILGTGLGGLVKEINITTTISYKDIPHFPVSTVESHEGKLILGKLGGKEVIAMQGRFHYYEGYTMQQITFPVRVMKALGIENIFISNASGGLNPAQKVSDLMILNDHINLLPEHPLRGKNEDKLGPRFPDMSKAYDAEFIERAKAIAKKNNIVVHEGVYASVQGPTLETKAEYKYIRIIGADAVGMSTVPECIVARHMDMRVFAISVITDLGVEGHIQETSIEDVINAATKAEPNLSLLIKELIASL
ncbi:MAG: purine-nucleoside phosphorylase [Bacteroidota bacterium]